MKLLFDANLSPELVRLLHDIFPGSAHVLDFGELSGDDSDIWDYALAYEYIIVTKDADFNEMSELIEYGPKIVWIRRGNCSTAIIERIIRNNRETIENIRSQDNLSVLVLF